MIEKRVENEKLSVESYFLYRKIKVMTKFDANLSDNFQNN